MAIQTMHPVFCNMLHVDHYCKMSVGDLKWKMRAPSALVALRGHSECLFCWGQIHRVLRGYDNAGRWGVMPWSPSFWHRCHSKMEVINASSETVFEEIVYKNDRIESKNAKSQYLLTLRLFRTPLLFILFSCGPWKNLMQFFHTSAVYSNYQSSSKKCKNPT